MKLRTVFCLAFCLALLTSASPAWAQKLFDDHEIEDRFYITLGGFSRDDIRTTIQLNAKAPGGGVSAGALIALESLFSVEDSVSTVRLDGWYRLNRKSRLAWTYWKTTREGASTYDGDDITVGSTTITAGDSVLLEDKSTLLAISYSYSFVNLEKFEAWLGGGFNFQGVDTQITVDIASQGTQTFEEEAKATVPIPMLNFGARYNFSKRLRMLFLQNMFGVRIGDFSGKLNDTRLLAEYNITKRFGFGGGFERHNLEVDADSEDFTGALDSSYTGFSLYLKGQI